MKKLLIILLALCLIFVGVAGCAQKDAPAKTPAEPAPAATPSPTPAAAPGPNDAAPAPEAEAETETAAPQRYVDMEALYALYPADMVYATVGEREITWGEYYEWLGTYILSGENYIQSTAAYGMSLGWDAEYAAGVTLAEYVVANLSDNFRAFTGIGDFAAVNGVTVSDEEIAAKAAEERSALLGPDSSDEDWAELLTSNFLTENVYPAQVKANLELTKTLDAVYGENGEKLSTASLQHFIEDKGYLRCNHILLLTMDMETREALDEATVAAKQAQAEELAAELQAIGDREELLARFAALKAEFDEDSGKIYYPDGYIFTPGTMVSVFEDTTRALRDYEVSDPVLSEYGYHVIIRLPIGADTLLDDGDTIGTEAAGELMAADLDEIVDALDFTLAPGAEPVDLTAFLAELPTK